MFTPVPQGRLSLAQDVVLGGLTQIAIVPQGRLVQPLQAEDKLWTKGTAFSRAASRLALEGFSP
jgi:hypothetical protein